MLFVAEPEPLCVHDSEAFAPGLSHGRAVPGRPDAVWPFTTADVMRDAPELPSLPIINTPTSSPHAARTTGHSGHSKRVHLACKIVTA
jgi:hypothetical protein